jgi:ATP-binding cassette subfamily C (CFTR/MRP) protein 1
LLLAPLRVLNLLRRRIKVRRSPLHTLKLAAVVVYATLQLALLGLWAADGRPALGVVAAAISVLASAVLVLLSHLEHGRSIRPSALIALYLLVTLLFDVARARTLWLLLPGSGNGERGLAVAAVFTATVGIKAVVIVLEGLEKRKILLEAWRGASRESTSSVFSRGLFWWLNRLLIRGFRSVLSVDDDLLAINERLGSEKLAEKLQERWDECELFKGFVTMKLCS